jgi:hypothetical protein
MKYTLLTFIFAICSTLLFSQTRTEIKTADLQTSISEYLVKNLGGYLTDKVFRLDAKGVISYEVCVTKDNNHEKLTFDKEGKFLKKESCGTECWKSSAKDPLYKGKQTGQPAAAKPEKK